MRRNGETFGAGDRRTSDATRRILAALFVVRRAAARAAWQLLSAEASDGSGAASRKAEFSPMRVDVAAGSAATEFTAFRRSGTRAPVLAECLRYGKVPTQSEIERVAQRIWSEMEGPTRRAWQSLARDSLGRRRALSAARAALGEPAVGCASDPEGQNRAAWQLVARRPESACPRRGH